MKKMLLALSVLAMAGSATAAAPNWDRPVPRAQTGSAQDDAVRSLHQLAGCIAERRTSQARALLAMDRRSDDFYPELQRLADREKGCVDHPRIRANARLFTARLAESLVRDRLNRRSLSQLVRFDPARGALAATDESEMMSLCVVRRAPEQVAALFATDPASRAEEGALRALAPHLSPCLARGVRGEFNRPGLRSLLGLAAYRLAEHNEEAPGRPALRFDPAQ